MARTKKQKTETECTAISADQYQSYKPLRDNNGLLQSGVDYKFNEYGLVDWRALIKPEHIVLNRYVIGKKKGIDLFNLSPEAIQELQEKATEDELLIKLQGFKNLAYIRGYKSKSVDLLERTDTRAVVRVTIDWLPNFEDPAGKTVSAIKNSSIDNTDPAFLTYMEAIAENRAFVTVVRDTLNIPIIGFDEIDNTKSVELSKVIAGTPQFFLKQECEKNGISFDVIAARAKEKFIESWEDGWADFSQISAAVASTLLQELKF